ncbi:MAG: helix-turn-helix domain-containing protein, partial [Selenomonas artemidis]
MSGEYEVISYEQLSDLNVFLVRMQERATHLHPDMELGLVLDGGIVLERGGARRTLRRGDLYLVNPLEAHCFTSTEEGGGVLLIAQISARLVERIFSGAKNIRYACGISLRTAMPRQCEELSALLTELGGAFFARRSSYEFQCLACVGRIYHLLNTHLPWSFLDTSEEVPRRERADRMLAVLDYIEKNYTRKLLLGEIARREHLSLTYLSHLFKEVLGMSFQDYLRKKRFTHARRLVAETQRSILDISLCCGFSDVR